MTHLRRGLLAAALFLAVAALSLSASGRSHRAVAAPAEAAAPAWPGSMTCARSGPRATARRSTPPPSTAPSTAAAAAGRRHGAVAGGDVPVDLRPSQEQHHAVHRPAGATLLAATPANGAAYDAPEPNPAAGNYQDFGHTHWHNSLIWGENLKNVAIVGPGRIWGQRTGARRDPAAGGRATSPSP